MGSKISELTETGVAPTGGYIPIEHETANYKLSIKTLLENSTGGGGGEGGIIGYDTNLKTGGRGARTLGIGFSKQYRQDAVTVSIRAVSVLTGEVLLNVQSRKTILSYGSGGDVFRFIEEGTQLVEIEDGVGNNESVTYATRSAIEAGVLELIYQGHERGFWEIEDLDSLEGYENE